MLRLRSRFLPARPALPALLAVLPLALAPLAGCTSSSSSATGGGTARPATTPASPAATTASPAAAGGGTTPAAPQVFLAEGGDVGGTSVFRPACASGCGLSGDGTTALWNMTWTAWTSTGASGAGTEKIDDCNPNCAAGTLHAVAVRVTFSKPVKATCHGTTRLYWTRTTFVWPNGLPAAFSGQNAPENPFDYPGIGGSSGCS
jgi:hypothetical protein